MPQLPRLVAISIFFLASAGSLSAQDSRPAKTPAPEERLELETDLDYPSGETEKAKVTIVRAALEPGFTLELTSTCDVKFQAAEKAGGVELRGFAEALSTSARVSVTVTGADEDGRVTSLGFRVLGSTKQGKPVAGAEGLTFSAELNGQGKIVLLTQQAKPLPLSSVNTLCKSVARGLLGEASGHFAAPLPKGELKPGAKVRFEEKSLLHLLKLGQTLKSQEAIYQGTRKVGGKVLAVFKLRATTSARGQTLVVGGELLIEPKTGLLAGADLLGALTIKRGRKASTTEGQGEVRIRRNVVGW